MKKVNTARQGFTKTGFTKNGFSCCSSWHMCDYGKNGCVIADRDSEAKEYCHCFQRNNQFKKEQVNKSIELETLFNSEDDTELDTVDLFSFL